MHAIEAGRAAPAVDVALRLARALDCTVEALFGSASEERISAEVVGENRAGRVALARIGERWCSYLLAGDGALRAADAIATPCGRGKSELELLRSAAECRENFVLMGCAPALGVLAERLNARPGPGRFSWFTHSSTQALSELAKARTHLAGVHLVDAATGEANLPDIRRHLARRDLLVVTLGHWQAGLLVQPGNPQRITGVSSFGRRARVVVREKGSGARRLWDRELARADVREAFAAGTSIQASGHLEVARAIALGAADVGVATRDAALAFGLGFVPLAEERYDLVVPASTVSEPRMARLFDTLASGAFRRELSALGYDVEASGERVAEILAA